MIDQAKIRPRSAKLLLLSAAFSLFGAHAGRAADMTGDAQSQAASVLRGSPAAGPPSAEPNMVYGQPSRIGFDAQFQAKRLILGEPAAGGPADAVAARRAKSLHIVSVHERALDRVDAQKMAGNLLMGRAG